VIEETGHSPQPLRPESVRGIVFDLDGTLVDSFSAISESLNHARLKFGMPPLPATEVRHHVGRGLEVLIEELIGAQRIEPGVRLFRERYAEVFRRRTSALPGALDSLRVLRRHGYRLSVASNKPARFGEPILEALGMRPLLDAVQGPDLAGTTKPEPTMLRNCLSAMGLPARQGLYVGDMVLDVKTAACAGLPVVLVGGGASDETELRATGERYLDSVSELVDLLPRLSDLGD
jgi:2-phosphoglycolate phosphatase